MLLCFCLEGCCCLCVGATVLLFVFVIIVLFLIVSVVCRRRRRRRCSCALYVCISTCYVGFLCFACYCLFGCVAVCVVT